MAQEEIINIYNICHIIINTGNIIRQSFHNRNIIINIVLKYTFINNIIKEIYFFRI